MQASTSTIGWWKTDKKADEKKMANRQKEKSQRPSQSYKNNKLKINYYALMHYKFWKRAT